MANLGPNNTQYACAVACVCDPKRARTFLAVPSGQGKSRIIATIIALKAEIDGVIQFAIVFPNELLARVNAEDYKNLDQMLSIRIKIVTRGIVLLQG